MPTDSGPIGFIGLGRMGGPMASRLIEAGHQVRGVDLNLDATARFAAAGGTPADDAATVAGGCTVLILMLPDSNAVETVLHDEDVLAAIAPNTLLIDMSSSEPLRTRQLATMLHARDVQFVDAPVSGGVSAAMNGSLTVMAGGDDLVVATARPLLELFGRVNHVGPVGSGHVVKALNNWLSATHLLATSEAITVGEELGLDPATMLAIFNGSSGRSGSTENKWPNFILPGTFDSGFGLRLMLKDVQIAVNLAADVGHPTDLGTCVARQWKAAADGLPPDADHTQIATWVAGSQVTRPAS